jgi:predicted small lipoprotein YifL
MYMRIARKAGKARQPWRDRCEAGCLIAFLALTACGRRDPENAPDSAVRALVEHLADASREPHSFPEGAHDAYRYLATSTKKKLELRAERASKLQGRRIGAEDMLVVGRFALRFEPRVYASVIRGEHAEVEVRGDRNDDVAKVLCVREPHATKDNVFVWRVELEVPDAPPLQKQERLP